MTMHESYTELIERAEQLANRLPTTGTAFNTAIETVNRLTVTRGKLPRYIANMEAPEWLSEIH